MSKLFYRFRSTARILENKELENQEIYFASSEKLNDPMEGFKDLVFNGGNIVWKNFFKHYLMCLERISSLYIISGEEHYNITLNDIPIYNGFDNFPTPMYKNLFEKISKEFFDICGEFIEKISTRTTPIRRNELSMYLDAIHLIAIKIIEKRYEEEKFIPKKEETLKNNLDIIPHMIKLIDSVEKLLNEDDGINKVNVLISIQKKISEELNLIRNINDKLFLSAPNRYFVLVDFVSNYLNSIEKLTYPKSYVSCFSGEEASHNSSLWGHYGDGHKGICLIFESNKDETLSFTNTKIGYGSNGVILDRANQKFYKVDYADTFLEIDFFKSLGRLTIPTLEEWYYDENNDFSDIKDEVLGNQDMWRTKYWDTYQKNSLIKTKDWQYEDEYRLILNAGMDGEIDDTYRLLKYDFYNLKGLIFGIKTTREEKLKIIEIIQKKCVESNRDNFEFYQADYCHINKNIQHRKLGSIKFNVKEIERLE